MQICQQIVKHKLQKGKSQWFTEKFFLIYYYIYIFKADIGYSSTAKQEEICGISSIDLYAVLQSIVLN